MRKKNGKSADGRFARDIVSVCLLRGRDARLRLENITVFAQRAVQQGRSSSYP